MVRCGTAEAGAGDVWVGGGGAAVVRGSANLRAGMGNAGGRDGAGGAGGDADRDSGGDDCGARGGARRPGICGDRRGGGAVDRADRSAAGLAPCGAGAAAVPAVRYLEAVADPEAPGAARWGGDSAL